MSDTFFQKPLGILTLVGGALFGPYAFFGQNGGSTTPTQPSASQYDPLPGQFVSSANDWVSGMQGVTGMPSTQDWTQPAAPVRPIVADLREVFRFDITPGWVPQNFSRVTTVLAETRLDGLRVPFVSGTQPTDIAGSLTYYFDTAQTVRRIQFHGKTGDPSMLAALMIQFYRLQPEASLGGHLYTTRWNNRITSVMQLSPAPVIYSHDLNARYQIFLEINQPSQEYGLTREAEQLLQAARINGSW